MRTFAKKPKATQQTTSAKSTKPSRSFVGQSHDVHSILHLHRTIGNQAVLRLLQSDGTPLKKFRNNTRSITPDRRSIAAKGIAGSSSAIPYKKEMEQAFNWDFSRVRVHNDPIAKKATTALGTKAYTVGRDVVFGSLIQNKSKVAHEPTHIVQQEKSAHAEPDEITSINSPVETGYDAIRGQAISLGIQARLEIGEANDRYEQEADRVAEQVMRQPEQDRQPATDRLRYLLHSDQRISRSIRTRGDQNFDTTVRNDLDRLTGSTAQNLLSTLRSSWSLVEINQADQGWATGMVHGVALVHYNPVRCPCSPRDDFWDGPDVPNAIYLAHELIHAWQRIEGRSASTEPVREWQTVGFGRHATLPYTENRIRCEMGLPLRTFYYADDPQRYRLQGFSPPRCDNNTYSQPVLLRPHSDLIEPPSTPIQVGEGILGPGETLQPKLEDNRSSWSPEPAISALSTPRIQCIVGGPRPIAVRYGPELMPFHHADIHGIIFDTDVICGGCTASIGNMHLFEEREQLSDSFGHQGSFRQVRGSPALQPTGKRLADRDQRATRSPWTAGEPDSGGCESRQRQLQYPSVGYLSTPG